MTQWEYYCYYKILAAADDIYSVLQEVHAATNQVGRDGWEMVNFAIHYSVNGLTTVVCFFKRPISS